MQNVAGLTVVATATKFRLGAEIQSPTGLLLLLSSRHNDCHHYLVINVLWVQVNVKVTTVDAELEFTIQSNATGRRLFDQVSCHFTPCY